MAFPELQPNEIGGDLERYRIVDVREDQEFDGPLGHLEGAELIPLSTLADSPATVPADRPLLLVCRSGKRSRAACEMLQEHGVEEVTNLAGGMIAWNQSGLPLVPSEPRSLGELLEQIVCWLAQVGPLTETAAIELVRMRFARQGIRYGSPSLASLEELINFVAESLESVNPPDLDLSLAHFRRSLAVLWELQAMSPLGVALSLLIGVSLGFFGGGGSILTVPLLVYVFGLEPKTAIASSLLIVAAASCSAAFQHWRAGNVELRTALLFGSAGMTGAFLGGRAADFVDGTLLLLLFAAMMALTAAAMWRGRRGQAPQEQKPDPARLLVQGFSVGLLTGLVGAGGGFLIVPALVLWAGLPMPAAVGTSLLIIVLNSLAGFTGYASHVRIDPLLVSVVATTAIAGSVLGARLAHRVDPASLRRAFAGFVAVMASVILVREADAWLDTARAALPATAPQIAFALLVLAVGIAAGRVTRRSPADPLAERVFSQGGGI